MIISDGGPAFASEAIENYLKGYDTERKITHPHLPSAHGLVERVNKSVLEHLSKLLLEVRSMEFDEWYDAIPMVEYMINTTTHGSTGYAPCTLIYGTDSVEDLQMMSKTELNMEAIKVSGGHDKWLKTLDSNLRQMRKASVLYQDKMAVEKYTDSIEGTLPDPLEIDSYVLKVARPPQQELKLHLKYTGPYKVVTKLRPDFYEILDLVQDQTEKVHRNELVKCICENDEVARSEASKDSKELFIEEVVNHTGEPQKQGTVMFECRVQGHSKPYFFKFKDCKFVKIIQDYIRKNKSLHYLLRDTISNDGEKRRSVGKYSNPSSAYIFNF